jgi:uncharacterized protein (DUF924 family)
LGEDRTARKSQPGLPVAPWPGEFGHAEDRQSQARAVALVASLGDPELQKWAEAHRAIVDRFGRFPHRNGILGRNSTSEETEFLKEPNSSF